MTALQCLLKNWKSRLFVKSPDLLIVTQQFVPLTKGNASECAHLLRAAWRSALISRKAEAQVLWGRKGLAGELCPPTPALSASSRASHHPELPDRTPESGLQPEAGPRSAWDSRHLRTAARPAFPFQKVWRESKPLSFHIQEKVN